MKNFTVEICPPKHRFGGWLKLRSTKFIFCASEPEDLSFCCLIQSHNFNIAFLQVKVEKMFDERTRRMVAHVPVSVVLSC